MDSDLRGGFGVDKKTKTRSRVSKAADSAKRARPANPAREKMIQQEIELDLPRLLTMIRALMTHLESGDLKGKASVADLVRLLQLYKELSEEQIKEVEVRWVDQTEPDGEAGE